MSNLPTGLLYYLQQIPDPRGRQGQRHSHTAMLAAITCAGLCGINNAEAASRWLREMPIRFWHSLGGTRRPPSTTVIRECSSSAESQLAEAVAGWMAEGLNVRGGATEVPCETLSLASLTETLRQNPVTHMTMLAFADLAVLAAVGNSQSADYDQVKTLVSFVCDGRLLAGQPQPATITAPFQSASLQVQQSA